MEQLYRESKSITRLARSHKLPDVVLIYGRISCKRACIRNVEYKENVLAERKCAPMAEKVMLCSVATLPC